MRPFKAAWVTAVVLCLLSGCTTPEGHPVPPTGFRASASDDTIVQMPDGDAPAQAGAPSGQTTSAAPASTTPAAAAANAAVTPSRATAAAATTAATAVPAGTIARVRFTPVIGAPVAVIRPLSSQLATAARAHGIAIRPSTDTATDNILRGYFSASTDGRQTLVVYVWDILDNAGNRLDRIQGQETVRRAPKDDPWTAVPPATMQTIADKTIAGYLAFLQARSRS